MSSKRSIAKSGLWFSTKKRKEIFDHIYPSSASYGGLQRVNELYCTQDLPASGDGQVTENLQGR